MSAPIGPYGCYKYILGVSCPLSSVLCPLHHYVAKKADLSGKLLIFSLAFKLITFLVGLINMYESLAYALKAFRSLPGNLFLICTCKWKKWQEILDTIYKILQGSPVDNGPSTD